MLGLAPMADLVARLMPPLLMESDWAAFPHRMGTPDLVIRLPTDWVLWRCSPLSSTLTSHMEALSRLLIPCRSRPLVLVEPAPVHRRTMLSVPRMVFPQTSHLRAPLPALVLGQLA